MSPPTNRHKGGTAGVCVESDAVRLTIGKIRGSAMPGAVEARSRWDYAAGLGKGRRVVLGLMSADAPLAKELAGPLRPRPYLLAKEVPQLMAQPLVRGRHLPLRQFVKDWYAPLANRAEMVVDPLGPDVALGDAVRIATVVHALCDLESMAVPSWVYDYRFEDDEMLIEQVPWHSTLGDSERRDAPSACQWHRCWFGTGFFEVLGVHVG